jgi:hypothetical protein
VFTRGNRLNTGVICFMKLLLPTASLLFFTGCPSQHELSNRLDLTKEYEAQSRHSSYDLLTESPDAILNEMASKYSKDNQQWQNEWTQDVSVTPIDGKKAIRLLEIACYADVVCHRVEYPLCVATLDYIRSKLDSPDVRDALHWILSSYHSGLPLDAHGDDVGHFKGLLVQSMKIRLTEYANELLQSHESAENRK